MYMRMRTAEDPDYFMGGGRAPLLFDAIRFMEAPLDLCRTVAKQVEGPQSAARLVQVLIIHTGWFMEPMATGGRPSSAGCWPQTSTTR